MQNAERWICILGATSAIARATAEKLAAKGYSLILTARNQKSAQAIAADLQIRFGVKTQALTFDAANPIEQNEICSRIEKSISEGIFYGVLACYAAMLDQADLEDDPDKLTQMLELNFVSTAVVLQSCANLLQKQGQGFVAGISSVAGDRGRGSNYAYGASKAGLTAFLNGLRHRLRESPIRVLTILPGPVLTPMTRGIVKAKSPLTSQPEKVGRDIANALDSGFNGVIYTPWFWRWIMLVIRLMPGRLFNVLDF